jgi:hypothetical protein
VSERSVTLRLCPVCKGHGTRVLGGAVFTAEVSRLVGGKRRGWLSLAGGLVLVVLDEAGPDLLDDMAAGVYDTQCDACQGLRVVDEQRMIEWGHELADQRMADAENGIPSWR